MIETHLYKQVLLVFIFIASNVKETKGLWAPPPPPQQTILDHYSLHKLSKSVPCKRRVFQAVQTWLAQFDILYVLVHVYKYFIS